jgi:hypothetical protein
MNYAAVAETRAVGQNVELCAPRGRELSRPAPFAIREAVGVFYLGENLQEAINALRGSGFHRAELSLLRGESAVQAKLGQRYEKANVSMDGPTIPPPAHLSAEAMGGAESRLIGRLIQIEAVVAAGAVVAPRATRAADLVTMDLIGAQGGLIGSILAKWVGDHHAHFLWQKIEHGGQLLWVRTWNSEDAECALEVLKRCTASEVWAHALPAET